MAQYGYKLSGLARSEKFFEAEHYLDKRLKGFEKDNAVFADDGSRTQVYRRKSDEGEQTVTLVKNITESGVLVFSDIELKDLKHGGIILYLRDILWQAAFAALYWIGYPKSKSTMPIGIMMSRLKPIGTCLVISIAVALLMIVTYKLVAVRRTPARVRFIQTGGVFSIVMMFYTLWSLTFKHGGMPLPSFVNSFVQTPLAPLLIGCFLLWLIPQLMKGRQR